MLNTASELLTSLSKKTTLSQLTENDPMLSESKKQQAIKQFYKRYDNGIASNPDINIKMFLCFRTLGQGSFGRVLLAYCWKWKKFYALKLLNKEKLVKQRQIDHTINEKQILYACNHPNIVKVHFLFKDASFLYFGIEYLVGGDLYAHLKANRLFNETTSRFYISQILSCFDYLHSLNVIYRDLKPENILISSKGYLKLVDFGFAKRIEKRTYTLCGTPDYLSPEVLKHQAYGKSVDWWSFGVFCFEMNAGEPPFKGVDHVSLYENICKGKFKCPSHFSPELVDLCKRLLNIDATQRLGCLKRATFDVLEHPWFSNFPWDSLYRQEIRAPYLPPVKSHLLWALEKSKKKEEPIKINPFNKYDEFDDFFSKF